MSESAQCRRADGDPGSPFRFDGQAASFDRRTGLPAAAIAGAVLDLAGPGSDTGCLLEVGAGTGEIGAALVRLGGSTYLGLDLSLSMLVQAHRRPGARGACWLAADADRPWPVRDGTVRLVFLSRAAHLLAPERLLGETFRVAHPRGARLALGRVKRQEASVRTALRREMRRLLAAEGIAGRRGEEAHRRLVERFGELGATATAPRVVATWTVEETTGAALAAWREKPGLAGTALPSARRDAVLDRLAAWARERYGDPARAWPAEESYELSVVELSPREKPEKEESA